MGRDSFIVDQGLPTLNEIIKASKRHWGMYSSMKKEYNDIIVSAITDAGCVPCAPHARVDVTCTWYENGKKRDPDNVMCGIKFVLDAMVHAGVIVNDTRDNIASITHRVVVDKERSVVVEYIY